MSKGRYVYHRSDAKVKRDQEDKQQKREVLDASKGIVDDLKTFVERATDKIEKSKEAVWLPSEKRKWYVLDTNLILSCVDVIYDANDEKWRPPLDFRPSLDNAHLIIPETVFEELNQIKDGFTINRSIARKAFRRLKQLFPNSERRLKDIMELAQPIRTGWKHQTISILPLHKGFKNSLPWTPAENDHDGWIVVTALAATMIRDGLPVDGSVSVNELLERSNARRDVVLLTNDNALLSKADQYGVRSRSYSFVERPPFTGLRELTVPAEMFESFYYEQKLSKEDFEHYLPSEPALIANEYVVMTPENDAYPRAYFATNEPFSNVARYNKANQMLYPLRFIKREGETPPNVGIATYYDAMNDDGVSVIVVTGKAGTGKTYQIVRHSIKALRAGKYSMVVLIVNSDNGVGYLPGNQEQKLEPMVAFCKDAIRSYLAQTPEFKKKRETLKRYGDVANDGSFEDTKQPIAKRKRRHRRSDEEYETEFEAYGFDGASASEFYLKKETSGTTNGATGNGRNGGSSKTYHELLEEQVDYIYKRYFMAIPYKQAQGRSFEDAIIIVDEAQRIVIDEMETFITRPARNSLLVACGDVNQIKFNSPEKRLKNGLIFTRRIYYDWDGCANIHLTDNMRHEAAEIANRNYEKVIEEIGSLQT